MEKSKKHIDKLVTTRMLKQDELVEIGRKIAALSTPIVVAFVDLAESTQMKQDRKPEEWLGYIFEFIKHVEQRAQEAKGLVVKRIGDELMVTFQSVQASERFVDSLIARPAGQMFRYKIAVDFGNAYHFRFIEHLPDDPYGPVVDRCARIAKYAGAGTIICSGDYRNQVDNPASYVSAGSFTLRGFRDPEELFARSLVVVDSEKYLKSLINMLNEEGQRVQGYRFVGRKLTSEYVREFSVGGVRPFLARELLNVPKLPYSPAAFDEITRGTGSLTEKEHEFLGYFVEWEGAFESFTRESSEITANLKIGIFPAYFRLTLRLPLNNLDLVKALRERQRLRARGIIQDIYMGNITLNYVDLEIVPESGNAS